MQSLLRLPGIDQHAVDSLYPNHTIGMLLYTLAYANGSRSVVEIGYNKGYSAVMLCAGVHDSGSRGAVVSVDISPCDGGRVVQTRGYGGMHRFIQGDSVGVAPQVASLLGRPIDLLLVDGDHSYEGCKRDWLAYKPFLDDQAIVLFHDNHLDAIKQVLIEIVKTGEGWQIVDLKGHGGLTMMRRQLAGTCIDGQFRTPAGELLRPNPGT